MKVKKKQIDRIMKLALVAAERYASEKTYLEHLKKDDASYVDSTHYRSHESQCNYHAGEKDALYEVLSIMGIDLRIMPGV